MPVQLKHLYFCTVTLPVLTEDRVQEGGKLCQTSFGYIQGLRMQTMRSHSHYFPQNFMCKVQGVSAKLLQLSI